MFKLATELSKGQPTGYQNPICYMRSTNDCCHQQSREHHMTKAILQIIRKYQINSDTGGYYWLKGQRKILGIQARQSWILCRRHNSMLSPFDTAGTRLFEAIYLWRFGYDQDRTTVLASGHDIERWVIQRALAIYHSGNATKNGTRVTKSARQEELMLNALLHDQWLDCAGLIIHEPPPRQSSSETTPIIGQNGEMIGCRVTMANELPLWVIWDPPLELQNKIQNSEIIFRPAEVHMTMVDPHLNVKFSWRQGSSPGQGIRIGRRKSI